MMFSAKNLVLALSLSASTSYATTCIVDYTPAEKLNGVLDRLNFAKKRRIRDAEKNFYIGKIKTSSCYRASLIASECRVDREQDYLAMHDAALASCEGELKKTIKAKLGANRVEAEMNLHMTARTGCNEEHDDRLDRTLCYMDLAANHILELNPRSESGRDMERH